MEHNNTVDGYYLDTNGSWIDLTITSDGLKFYRATGTITGYSGSNTDVTIPSEIDGVPVTSIGQVAFTGCKSLTSIKIPNSVTFIGNIAFEECNGLKSIGIPSSVEYISGGAFKSCANLTTVNVSSATRIAAHVFDYSLNVKVNTVN